ncbi:MAG: phage tail assembly protein [Amaricoccus sp.]|uniref:phage tail assembly protein n=1 Tax=Amaricoccus sp. TaxID=1872485 RepID=UPI0039E577E5
MGSAETPTTAVVPLGEPVTVAGQTYDTLTLHRCRTRHLLAMDLVKGETRKAAALFASMAGVPLPVIEELAVDDFARVGEAAAPLMGNSGWKALADAQRQAAAEASP